MKILFITAFPPNRRTAGQNYTRNLLTDLSSDYEIDVFYWEYPGHLLEGNEKVLSYNRITIKPWYKVFANYLIFFPLFSKRFSLSFLKKLKSLSSNYDIIYFDFSQTFIYSAFLNHPFMVGMAHDVISQKYSRTKLKILLPWIKLTEKFALRRLKYIFTFSNKDQFLLQEEYNKSSRVVPFFIEPNICKINIQSIKIHSYFVMYGAWNRTENQESLKWVLDNSVNSNNRILIIGGNLPLEFEKEISTRHNFEYLGFIDNPYEIIAQSKGLIAPLFNGAGVKVKAIESLALGTPILGTDITFEGLPSMKSCALIKLDAKMSLIQGMSKLEQITINIKEEIQREFKEKYVQRTFKEQLKSLII